MVGYSNDLGSIHYSEEVLAKIVGLSTMECYGVVGMAKKNSFNEIDNFFKKDNFYQGVVAKKNKANTYEIDLFIIVAFGVRITEVVSEVQKKVKYDLEQKFNIKFKAINVYVQGIKNI